MIQHCTEKLCFNDTENEIHINQQYHFIKQRLLSVL